MGKHMFEVWRKPTIAVLLVMAFGLVPCARAETIAIIGTGNVGAALGQRFAEAGHTIIYGSRNPDREEIVRLVAATGSDARAATQEMAAQAADIIVLAVPWDVALPVTRSLGNLSGRVIIDPTNPRRIAADGLRDYAFDGSNAERIQAVAPGAQVVKALSSLGAETMRNPAIAGGPVSVPIAGDDASAKQRVARLVAAIGLEPVDVGPLRYAHVIEGLHFLRYNAGQFGDARVNFYLPPDPID
jgi:8-hydroxy-5-deazaflavin:NADPH oxidoreductase